MALIERVNQEPKDETVIIAQEGVVTPTDEDIRFFATLPGFINPPELREPEGMASDWS